VSRNESRRRRYVEAADVETFSAAAAVRDVAIDWENDFREFVRRLPVLQRRVLEAVAACGNARDAAAHLGCTPRNVERHLARLRGRTEDFFFPDVRVFTQRDI
jgi:DNA-directed RNA polymerase specialized sigma24 family protein